jgi:hypothetical protein
MTTWIVFYSLTGRTRAVCGALTGRLGAVAVEIAAPLVRPGLWAMLRWGYAALSGGHTPVRARPIAFAPGDTLILGAQVWAGRVSVPMRSWLAAAPPLPPRVALVLTSGDARFPDRAFDQLAALCDRAPVARLHVAQADADAGTFDAGIESFVQALGGVPRA